MAENTNYIGVAMGLDVSDLKSGLNEASKSIGKANAEFKSATGGMDDWSKSVEGISAKVTQLDTVLTAQKKKLAGLTAEYKKVAKEQGENSVAAQNLYIKMKNQESVVKATEREYNNYKETLEAAEAGTLDLENATLKAGKAVDKMGDEAEESGKSLDGLKSIAGGVVKGIAAIGTAVVGVIGGFLSLASATRETRENFNKLETGFTTAGHTAKDATNTYRELYGVLGDEGQATEAAAHLALLANNQEDLSKWTNIATGVYATFGDSLPIEGLTEAANETAKTGKLTGVLADALNWAGVNEDEFQAKLDATTSEQERQALITSTLNGLYSEQSDKFKELNKDIIEAREADAELAQAMADLGAIAEPIMTTLKLAAVDLLEAIKPFVDLIGEGLKGALDGTAGATDQLAEGIGGLLTTLAEKLVSAIPTLIETVVLLIGTIVPQILTTLANQLPTILQALITGFSQILTQLGAMLPDLIPVVIQAILTIVETLIDNVDQLIEAGISLIMGLADGLIKALPILVDKIPVIIEKLITAFVNNYPKLIKMGMDLLIKLGEGLIQAIPQLVSQLPQIISSIVSGITTLIPELISLGGELLAGLFKGFLDPKAIWDAIKSLGNSIVDAAKSFFGIHSPSKLMEDEIGKYLGTGVGVGLLDSMPAVKKQLGQFSNFITDNLGNIKTGLDISANGSLGSSGSGGGVPARGNTVIDARQTVNYNGKLSRRQVKELAVNNYTAVTLKMKTEGLI